MERILKILLITFIIAQPAISAEVNKTVQTNTTQTQNVEIVKPYTDFSSCTKTFNTGVEKLFYIVLSAINDNDFQLREIQTKGGYIIFETGYRKFLASVIYVSSSKSMLKITPYSGNYDFSPDVVKKVFDYVNNYLSLQQQKGTTNEI